MWEVLFFVFAAIALTGIYYEVRRTGDTMLRIEKWLKENGDAQ